MNLKAIRQSLQVQQAQDQIASARRSGWRKRIVLSFVLLLLAPLATASAFRILAALRETESAAAIAPPTGRYVAVGDERIFVQEKGPADAPPVILIHGTAAWSELWRDVIDPLSASGFRVIAIDVPPFGFSDRPADRSYDRASQARRIAGLMDELGLPKATLVGHSFGAGPTMETVLRYPEKVAGLVLIAGALGISDPTPAGPPAGVAGWVIETPPVRNLLVATLATNPLMTRQLLAVMIHRKEAADQRRAEVLKRPLVLRGTTPDLGQWLRYFVSPEDGAWSLDRGRYKDVTAATALIWGDRDTLTPLSQAEDIRGLIPGATLAVMPDVGHIPQVEDAKGLVPILIDALHRVAANGRR